MHVKYFVTICIRLWQERCLRVLRYHIWNMSCTLAFSSALPQFPWHQSVDLVCSVVDQFAMPVHTEPSHLLMVYTCIYIYIYMNIQVYAFTSSPRCGACAQCPLASYICCVCTRSVGSVICGLRLHSAPFTWPRLHSVAHSHLLIALQVYVVAELWTVLSLQLHLSFTASCRHSFLWLDAWPEPGHCRSSWPFFSW